MKFTPKKMKNRPLAVLFDYDGVLVSSETIHLLAWKQVLAELGLPQDLNLIQRGIGKTAPQIITDLLNRYRPNWSPQEFDVHEIARVKNDHYLSYAKDNLIAYPGAKEGISWLKEQNMRVAIVSNAKKNELEMTLQFVGLHGLFDVLLSRDDVQHPKPNPDHYLCACRFFHLNPSDCLAVEDSPTGMASALFGSIPVAGILTNYSQKDLENPISERPDLKPVWIGGSLLEFFSWLKSEVEA